MKKEPLQDKLFKNMEEFKEKTAIEYGNRTISYEEVGKRSNFIANWIINNGIEKQTFIGILIDDRMQFILTMIGILKAGCVFVPLDSTNPRNRLQVMIDSTDTKFIITDKVNMDRLKLNDIKENKRTGFILSHDIFSNGKPSWYTNKPAIPYSPEDKIYIYFTSGTTGTPQAIVGKNKSLLHFINWEIDTFSVNGKFRISQFTTPVFDAFLRDVFVPLYSGGTVCIPGTTDIILDPYRLKEWVEKSGIHLIHCVPALFRLLSSNTLNKQNFKELKFILLSGEKIHPTDLVNWYDTFDERIQLVNLWGTSETTLAKTFYLIQKNDIYKERIPVGKPMRGARVIILDEKMNVCDDMISGEIYIRTPYRTFGYYNHQKLNEERFIQNPFNNNPDDRIHKTGDLGRFLPDGNIELLGRDDRQVKIRGYRIELEEIENILIKHPPVEEAVVIKNESANHNESLDAYITGKEINLNEETWIRTLKEYLAENLPGYMVPGNIVKMEKIPRTISGKVDYKALASFLPVKGTYDQPPKNDIEKRLSLLWSEILKIEKIGVKTHFFNLGGNSLNVMTLITGIHKEFDIRLTLGEVFENPTIEEQAKIIGKSQEDKFESIKIAEKKEYYGLSAGQKRLYFIQQLKTHDMKAYNLPLILDVKGEIRKDRLEETFKLLIRRHEIFRTSFEIIQEEPIQRIHDEVEFEIEYKEIEKERSSSLEGTRGLAPLPKATAARSPQPAAALINSFIRPFELSQAPLLRIGMLKLGQGRHIFMSDMHHIIIDGSSQEIFVNEFTSLYHQQTLPPIKLQYKDYSEWQNSEKKKESLKNQENFWLKEFEEDIPILNLPTDYPRPPKQNFLGDTIGFNIGKEKTARLKALASKEEISLYMVLLAIFNLMLGKVSGQEDIPVGTVVAGRVHKELQKIIGFFVNTIVLRNYLIGNQTFIEFLHEVKKRTTVAFDNQEYPFEELVEKAAGNRDFTRNPLFDITFVLQNIHISKVKIPGLTLAPYKYEEGISKFDLNLIGIEGQDQLFFSFQYNIELFKPATVKRFITFFINIVSSILNEPGKQLSKIDLLTREEKHQILYEFNDTSTDYPKNKTIHQLFAEHAARTPDNIALIGQSAGCRAQSEDEKRCAISYKELNKQSNRTARLLGEKGVHPDTIVGIMMGRSVEMIIGILGILKSGGAYLPIDPEYPQQRIDYILKDSGAKILLTGQEIADSSSFGIWNLEFGISPRQGGQLAYVIYTSGTTGSPKGTLSTHSNVIRVVKNTNYIVLTTKDRVLQLSNYAFDGSVFDIYGALLNSSSLVMLRQDEVLSLDRLADLIKKEQITVFFVTTALFNTLVDLEIDCFDNIRKVLFGGEQVSVVHTKKAREYLGKERIIHVYGPTETTVYATYYLIDQIEERAVNIPIGKPISNTTIYIQDKNLHPVPIGVNGEIYIGGDGVARGYLNNPELTADKFRRYVIRHSSFVTGSSPKLSPDDQCPMTNDRSPHYPITPLPHSPIYRTGDLGRWLPDGNIEFLGRIDHQAKIRGFRIEPGEIEFQLLQHDKINESVVVAKEEKGSKYLCAYIISDEDINVLELRKFLSHKLPNYMMPAYFIQLDEMPLTPSGKTDREALPTPVLEPGDQYVAPRNKVEKKLLETWQNVLGKDNIGINDNFFLIGGDSIKTIQVAARMTNAGYKFDMKDIFQNPSIAELAPLVKKVEKIADQSVITGIVPLTPIQNAFFQGQKIDSHHFNQTVMHHLKDTIDEKTVRFIFTKIQQHHDALRMTYKNENGRIIQTNQGLDIPLALEIYDLHNSKNVKKVLLEKANEIQSTISLENGPLIKLGLFHLDDGDRLLIAVHHLVIDGVSWRILFEDIETLYRQYKNGEPAELPLKTNSFKLWAKKLSQYANSKLFLKEKPYWVKLEAASLQVPRIPKDFEIDDNEVRDTERLSFSLNEKQTTNLLTKVNEPFGTEINDILLTALSLGIKKTWGHHQVLIALEGHGREEIIEDIDISRTVGWFTSIYPVILNISHENDLARQIKEIKESLHQLPNKGIGYGILKYLTSTENKTGLELKSRPQVSFNYLGQFDAAMEQKSFMMARESTGNVVSMEAQRDYELDISGITANRQLNISISYSKKQFKYDTIKTLSEHYKEELTNLISYCSSREERELTPSDLTYKELSISDLEEFESMVEI